VFEADLDPGPELVAAFRSHFERPRDYQDFLRRWDIPEDDLTAILRRKARVQRYLESRISNGQLEAKEFVHDLRARAEIRILSPTD
jgi:hypothetical protein